MTPEEIQADTNLLTQIAVAYYQEGETQEAISQKFQLSRAKVGRLLKQAREQGIVEITVKYHPVFSAKLEQQLIERFKLKRALIALDQKDPQQQREQVAALAAHYLSTQLGEQQVVTVGQGRNVAAVAHHVGVVAKRPCQFVCGIGGIHPGGSQYNADHICRQFAKVYGGVSETLYAPAYAETKEQKSLFMANSTIKDTLDRARKADYALIGVGDMSDQSYMVDLGWFSAKEVVDARISHGIVGDIAGYDFIDVQGRVAHTVMNGRVIGLSVEEFRRIPEVIAIAAEPSKPLALLGALRTGAIDVLATSVTNALTLLNLTDNISRC
ncbi:Transcriptional regulator LsrR [Vibrio stylophorae]|uniref:Transcriptional regulator LsrR n=1 Tax=Vibrio stylophorae TaxID=659351 RepID=A0ABM8ZWT7_9VIBR|nr:sugar-binding transcriptional regulator [Vibrio stylophorae]CAH0535102.1 Transcriptional regulator LsrR [Vibrio stylophorae]